MRKQLSKGLWAASLIALLAGFAVPAEAAEIRCDVPFSFTVNSKTLPPGMYSFSTSVVSGAVLVRGPGRGVFSVTSALQSARPTDARIVLHKYGEHYILRQVWMGGSSGRELPESRLERELKESKLAGNLEQVHIAAR